jgi:hypothetical protein
MNQTLERPTMPAGTKLPGSQGWLRRHVWAVIICAVLFFMGIGLGNAGSSSSKSAAPTTITAPGATQTVTAAANPTQPQTQTVTETRTVTAQATTSSAGSGSASKPINFFGSGGLTLRPFRTFRPHTLSWTATGGLFQLFTKEGEVLVNSQASGGKTYLSPGTYTIQVNAMGDWTIAIK